MKRSLFATAALAALLVVAVRGAAAFDAPFASASGRTLLGHLRRGESGPLWAAFDPGMRTAMKDSASFAASLAGMSGSLGELDTVTAEKTSAAGPGGWSYVATCRFSKAPVELNVTFAFDADGRVSGLLVRPAAAKPVEHASAHLAYETKTVLRPPFEGEWYVVWGGRSVDQNYHAATRDQRFAMDLVILRDGRSHAGGGEALTDYHCYGKRVLAPAAGTVVWACDSLRDNPIGETDRAHAVGNGVVIDHGNGEYSLLAHLQPRSLKVKLGERVKSGQWLGLVGNSGNTSEPHIHYHLQNGPKPFEADGLPAPFTNIVVNGAATTKAEILKGQTVAPGN